MRPLLAATVLLASLLVASVASAVKPQTATAELTTLSSGIVGTADFKIDSHGNARVHEQISGLAPGQEYVSVIYLNTTACGSGVNVVAVTIAEFTANAAGKAVINVVIPPVAVPLFDGGASTGIQQGSTLVACGTII